MSRPLVELWQTLSAKVLSCVLVDDGAVFPVLEIIRGNTDWFCPQHRIIWRAVVRCVDSSTPPTVEAVIARCDESQAGLIKSVANVFTEEDNRLLVYNTEQLKAIGILAGIRQIGKALAAVDNAEEIDKAIEEANAALAGIYADKNERDGTAASVDGVAWQQIEGYTAPPIPTGIGWFDELSGGMWPGCNYWIAAPYKAGKSTLMRNVLLHAALKGFSVNAYPAEGTREQFVLDCQAMLATKILFDRFGEAYRSKMRLSGIFIRRIWMTHQDTPILTPDEYSAIQEARKLWQLLPIRVWDTRDGIRDLTTLRYSIKRDKMKHGLSMAWLDYSQLFGNGASIYERQSQTALTIQEIAQEEQIVMCALAQKSEQGIRESNGSYTPGVKGGGDAAAAADGLFVPEINQEQPDVIKLELKLSRHTATGKGAHLFDRFSGLILRELSIKGLGI